MRQKGGLRRLLMRQRRLAVCLLLFLVPLSPQGHGQSVAASALIRDANPSAIVDGDGLSTALVPAGATFVLVYHDSDGPGTVIMNVGAADTSSSGSGTGPSPLPLQATLLQNGNIYQGSGSLVAADTQTVKVVFSVTAGNETLGYTGGLALDSDTWSGQGTYQTLENPLLSGSWTMQGVLLQASSVQASATPQLVLGPTGAIMPPQGYALLLTPDQRRGAVSTRVPRSATGVNSQSDQPAAVATDGTVVTIASPQGFIVAPNVDCTPLDGQPNIVTCRAGDYSTFATVAVPETPQALPQEVTLQPGDVVSLTTEGSESASGAPATAALVIDARRSCCGSSGPIDAVWDGQTLSVTAPSGYQVLGFGRDCSPEPPSDSLSCLESGEPPRLLGVSSEEIDGRRVLPATPIPPRPLTITLPPSAAHGQPVTLSASTAKAPSTATYVWDFGDGSSLGSGQTVNHVYASPGVYGVSVGAYWPGGSPTSVKGFGSTGGSGVLPVSVQRTSGHPLPRSVGSALHDPFFPSRVRLHTRRSPQPNRSDPVSGQYRQANEPQPGQGALVISPPVAF